MVLFLLPSVACLIVAVAAAAGAGPRLSCQLTAGVVNCSASGSGGGSGGAYFVLPRSEEFQVQPTISLSLPPEQGDFSIASLEGLAFRFMPSGDLTVELTPGQSRCRLLPGCLNSLERMNRLTLRLQLADSQIPLGVFTARMARLQSLELETPRVAEVPAGAFSELRSLKRLSLANLQLDRLEGSLLRGLSALRVLELPNNWFARLDAASFAASPVLETIKLRSLRTERLTVAADTFCGLRSLRELQISAAAGLNCSHFASRQLDLALNDRAETRTVSCVRMLGEATVCSGTSGVRRTSTTFKATSTELSTIATSSPKTSVTTVRASKAATSKQSETAAAAAETGAKATQKSTLAIRTSTQKPEQTSTVSESKTGRRSDKQAASGASAASAGPIIVGVVAAVLLLAAVSVAIFNITRRIRLGGGSGDGLRRSHSQQPIFNPGGAGEAEIDMQDAVWNPSFQGGAFSAAAQEQD